MKKKELKSQIGEFRDCARCHKRFSVHHMYLIDNLPLCRDCLKERQLKREYSKEVQ